jgi:lysophospholipase L1-like esterase
MMQLWISRLVVLAAFGCGAAVDHYGLLSSDKSALWGRSRDLRTYRSPAYTARISFFTASPGHADIVMLGDSITALGEWKEMFPDRSIVNRGIGGDTSYGILDRLGEIIDREPNIVFLMIGINDLYLGAQPQNIVQNIDAITNRLRDAGIRVAVQSTLFVSNEATLNAKVRTLNSMVLEWSNRAEISYVDINAELAPNGELPASYTWDGVHLNGTAYLRWRDAIKPYVIEAPDSRARVLEVFGE